MRKGALLLIFISLFVTCNDSTAGYYQDKKAESTNPDTLYYDIFRHYRLKNIDSAFKYGRLGYDQAVEMADTLLIIKSLNALGYCYQETYLFDSALYVYKKGVQLSKGTVDIKWQIFLFNDIGIIYDDIGVYDSAMANFFNSLDLAKKLERPFDESVALLNIGNIDWDLGNAKSAINFYLQSLELKEEHDLPGIEICYSNLGLSYSDIEDHENAIYYFNQLIEFCDNDSCSTNIEEKALIGLGRAYLGLGDIELANFYINQVADSDDNQIKAFAFRSLADVAVKLKEYEQALDYINTSIQLAKLTNRIESIKNYYFLKSNIYKEMGMADSALFYYQNYIAMKDSLYNSTIAQNIQEIHLNFEKEKAKDAIRVKEREVAAKQQINILLASVIVLTITVIVLVLIYAQKRKKRNLYLDKLVKLRTSELSMSNQSLSNRTRDLDSLIYSISHQVRAPLARLLGLVNIGNLGVEKNYQNLKKEASDLESILQRLIIISNTNNHKVNKVMIDTSSYFNELLARSDYIWREKIKINLHLNDVSEITTDPDLLDIAMENMIENAARYRKRHGNHDPLLNIGLARENGGTTISLEDNGQGFNEEYKHSITDLFFVANENGGAGLGLYHSKFALDKMNCTLKVESVKDPTVFVIKVQ